MPEFLDPHDFYDACDPRWRTLPPRSEPLLLTLSPGDSLFTILVNSRLLTGAEDCLMKSKSSSESSCFDSLVMVSFFFLGSDWNSSELFLHYGSKDLESFWATFFLSPELLFVSLSRGDERRSSDFCSFCRSDFLLADFYLPLARSNTRFESWNIEACLKEETDEF